MESVIKALNNNESLKDLLAENPDIDLNNEGNESREIPLHLAAWNNNKDALEHLLENGADIDILDDQGNRALENLVFSNPDEERLSMIDFLIKKGAFIGSYLVAKIMLDELDFDILEYFIGCPQITFQERNIHWEFREYEYRMIKKFMEKKSWENAMRMIVVPANILFDNNYNLNGNDVDETGPGILETILEKMTDFSFVDENGKKFVDEIFNKYLEMIEHMDVNAGKKLLEAGADINVLHNRLFSYYKPINPSEKIIKKLIDTGADLNTTFPIEHYNRETCKSYKKPTPLLDIVYCTCAADGYTELVKEMLAKGANLASIFEYGWAFQMLMGNHDECAEFIFNQMKLNGHFKDKSIELKWGMGYTGIVDAVKDYEKEHILVNIGILAKPPTNLQVSHFTSGRCTYAISWTPGPAPDQFPVTGYQVDYERQHSTWKKAATVEGGKTNKFGISGFVLNDVVRFRVSARNEHGLSAPVEEPDYNKAVLVLPYKPGPPEYTVKGPDLTIFWTEPRQGTYKPVQEYRLEGRNTEKSEEWRSVGTVSSDLELKMTFYDFKNWDLNQFKIFAVNEDGESEASDCTPKITM